MPQDMVASLYYLNGLLLKMPYRFSRSYQLRARNSRFVLSGWFLSLDFQRGRP
jgi:hypothetical protein